MNLNYDYSKESMIELISCCDDNLDEHNVVIDFDGEVIIDPEKYYPNVPLDRYKFHAVLKHASLKYESMVAALYDSLELIYKRLDQFQTDITDDGMNDYRLAA